MEGEDSLISLQTTAMNVEHQLAMGIEEKTNEVPSSDCTNPTKCCIMSVGDPDTWTLA